MSTSTAEHDSVDSFLVENWDTDTLIDFLKEQNLKLDDDDLGILRKKKFNGLSFLELTKEDFMQAGLEMGPAILLAKEAKALKEKPKRPFSSYKSLKEVLAKYGIEDSRITAIPQFTPKTYNIEDEDEALHHCINDIRIRINNMGTVADSNEAVRCEYISTILHACIHIVKKLTGKEITLNPQLEVVGEESGGRVDYAIKCIEELIAITEGKQHQIGIGFAQNVMQCESAYQTNKRKRKVDDAFGEYDYLYGIITTATEWYFLLYTSKGISCTSEIEYHVSLTKAIAKEENEAELRKNVKRVMEVIVGLLKDRVDVEKEPKKKKARVQEYLKKE